MLPAIQDYTASVSILDVHEHHIPEILLNPKVGLLQLFQQSYAGWTQSRPYPLPSERRDNDPVLSSTGSTTWEALAPFLEHSGSNSFVRNLASGILELHSPGDEKITRENWERIDARDREQEAKPFWGAQVLDQAGIESLIPDPYTAPLLQARPALGNRYQSVVRINSFACGWHIDSRD